MAIRLRRRRKPELPQEVLATYQFPTRTVQVVRLADERVHWVCDCEKYRRWNQRREPPWCKHIAKAAARRSIERLTRRVARSPN